MSATIVLLFRPLTGSVVCCRESTLEATAFRFRSHYGHGRGLLSAGLASTWHENGPRDAAKNQRRTSRAFPAKVSADTVSV